MASCLPPAFRLSALGAVVATLDGTTAALGKEQIFAGDASANIKKASELRGVTGGYAVVSDITTTAVQV